MTFLLKTTPSSKQIKKVYTKIMIAYQKIYRNLLTETVAAGIC